LTRNLERLLRETALQDIGILTLFRTHPQQASSPSCGNIASGVRGADAGVEEPRACANCAVLLNVLKAIALSTGACPECWGQDDQCRLCSGLGKPGCFTPDPRCFDVFIRPVIDSGEPGLGKD